MTNTKEFIRRQNTWALWAMIAIAIAWGSGLYDYHTSQEAVYIENE